MADSGSIVWRGLRATLNICYYACVYSSSAPFLNYIKLQWDDYPFPRPLLPALLENDLSAQAFSGKHCLFVRRSKCF